ncbi:REJ domain-containing protein [Balamuthia mandrillaris]
MWNRNKKKKSRKSQIVGGPTPPLTREEELRLKGLNSLTRGVLLEQEEFLFENIRRFGEESQTDVPPAGEVVAEGDEVGDEEDDEEEERKRRAKEEEEYRLNVPRYKRVRAKLREEAARQQYHSAGGKREQQLTGEETGSATTPPRSRRRDDKEEGSPSGSCDMGTSVIHLDKQSEEDVDLWVASRAGRGGGKDRGKVDAGAKKNEEDSNTSYADMGTAVVHTDRESEEDVALWVGGRKVLQQQQKEATEKKQQQEELSSMNEERKNNKGSGILGGSFGKSRGGSKQEEELKRRKKLMRTESMPKISIVLEVSWTKFLHSAFRVVLVAFALLFWFFVFKPYLSPAFAAILSSSSHSSSPYPSSSTFTPSASVNEPSSKDNDSPPSPPSSLPSSSLPSPSSYSAPFAFSYPWIRAPWLPSDESSSPPSHSASASSSSSSCPASLLSSDVSSTYASAFLPRDKLLNVLSPLSEYLLRHQAKTDVLIVTSSLLIDGLVLFLLMLGTFGHSLSPLVALVLVHWTKVLLQTICSLPAPFSSSSFVEGGLIWWRTEENGYEDDSMATRVPMFTFKYDLSESHYLVSLAVATSVLSCITIFQLLKEHYSDSTSAFSLSFLQLPTSKRWSLPPSSIPNVTKALSPLASSSSSPHSSLKGGEQEDETTQRKSTFIHKIQNTLPTWQTVIKISIIAVVAWQLFLALALRLHWSVDLVLSVFVGSSCAAMGQRTGPMLDRLVDRMFDRLLVRMLPYLPRAQRHH